MGVLDYFKPVSTWSPEKVRQFLREKNQEDYSLLDVRTREEYEKEHLPGAQWIPIKELEGRLKEVDPNKLTVTY
jgi:rhodanese-related sulfurtransferase